MVIRKMKDKCKDAARMRREKERTEFVELSKLLPLPSSTTSQLDKASIIRLTSSYLRMRSAFPNGLGENWGTPRAVARASSINYTARVASSSSSSLSTLHHFDSAPAVTAPVNYTPAHQQPQIDNKHPCLHNQITHSLSPNQQTHIRELGSLILQTLDGFVFALHKDGKIMYISETASVLLGLPQIDLTGSSIFDYLHPDDHNDLIEMLSLSELDRLDIGDQLSEVRSKGALMPRFLELGRSFCVRMKCILPKRNAGLVNNGHKAIHCGGYLKVKCCSQGYQEQDQWDSYALVAVGHSLLPSASIEVKLSTTSFMFRANLDMNLFYIETPASGLLGHQQSDFLGRSLYQFVHVADSPLLEQAHKSLLSKSQTVSKYLRLMRPARDAAGFVWIQMCASLINNPRNMPKSQHIVGVCWIIGENQLDQSRFMPENPVASTQDTLLRQTTIGTCSTPPIQDLRKINTSGNLLMVAAAPRETKRASAGSKKQRLGGAAVVKRMKKSAQLERAQAIGRSKQSKAAKLPPTVNHPNHLHFSKTIGSLRRPSEDSSSVVSSIASSAASSRPPTATAAIQMTSAIAPRVSYPCSVSTCSASISGSSASSTSSGVSSSCNELCSPPSRYGLAPTTDASNMISSSSSAGQQPLYLLQPSPCQYVDPYTTAYNHHYDLQTTWTTSAINCHQESPTGTTLDHTQMSASMEQNSTMGGLYYQHHERTPNEAHVNMPYYEQHMEYKGNYLDEYPAFCDRAHQDQLVIQAGNTACCVGEDYSVS